MSLPVPALILLALRDRLSRIDGAGKFNNDMTGRVHLGTPSVDLDASEMPRLYLARRRLGESQASLIGEFPQQSGVLIYDVIGIAKSSVNDCEKGVEAEKLLADVRVAIEVPDDRFIKAELGNLLSDELSIVEPEVDPEFLRASAEAFGVGVRCPVAQFYGDPYRY